MTSSSPGPRGNNPKLLDRLRAAIRARHYGRRTKQAYVGWSRRFIAFHRFRHPNELGGADVNEFLAYLATRRKVSASTQNQALSAILFLYREVLGQEPDWIDTVPRAKQPIRLPMVLNQKEVQSLLGHMSGTTWLMASLLYGSGLSASNAAIAHPRCRFWTTRNPGPKRQRLQRSTDNTSPGTDPPLRQHIERRRHLYDDDFRNGAAYVELPYALGRKYPDARRAAAIAKPAL